MSEAHSSKTNIYEHGIAVENGEHPESLALIATAKLPIYSGFSLSIIDFKEQSHGPFKCSARPRSNGALCGFPLLV